uniref:Uncharacterized protein n=1 Tax=Meloidogyne enterolobii TaxID=390850 RepID=A0A6V7TL84_MELEN|nr:unnamed protein product [Meloidogyne enterolobii]
MTIYERNSHHPYKISSIFVSFLFKKFEREDENIATFRQPCLFQRFSCILLINSGKGWFSLLFLPFSTNPTHLIFTLCHLYPSSHQFIYFI